MVSIALNRSGLQVPCVCALCAACDAGQLGDGSKMDRLTPVQAVGVQGVALGNGSNILSLGEKHTCAVMAAGDVLCFGANDQGQLVSLCVQHSAPA